MWTWDCSHPPPGRSGCSKTVHIRTENSTAVPEANKLRGPGFFSCSMRPTSSLCPVTLHSRSTERQSSIKWGLSRELLNESETMSITLTGPQRRQRGQRLFQEENHEPPWLHCQVLWSTWWPDVLTTMKHGPGLRLSHGRLWHSRKPHVDELCRSWCDIHWKALAFPPKGKGSRDSHSYCFRRKQKYWDFCKSQGDLRILRILDPRKTYRCMREKFTLQLQEGRSKTIKLTSEWHFPFIHSNQICLQHRNQAESMWQLSEQSVAGLL